MVLAIHIQKTEKKKESQPKCNNLTQKSAQNGSES